MPEIEGLRAVAVLAVLVFHIWPHLLPGGFIGVDVFFVISGFLITGILLKDAERNGRISFAEFYARRIRRLMPAATLVLVFIILALPLLPQARWPETVHGVIASTLYVQNWFLASQSVDYLASEQAPSILQHFWSLSVEEQYYIFWPLILFSLALLPGIGKFPPATRFRAVVLAVVVASFAYSMHLTYKEPGLAYFSTLTRAWELGIGSLLAVTVWWRQLSAKMRDAIGLLGLMLIGAGLMLITTSTPFPGAAALMPVLGTALVIVAGDSGSKLSAYALLKFKPLQYLGAISYSLYLWHWPVRVLHDSLFHREPGWLAGLGIIAVSIVFAHLSKAWVEDRFRRPGDSGPGGRRPLAWGTAAACATVAVALAGGVMAPVAANLIYGRADAGGPAVAANPGARVFSEGELSQEGAALVPSVLFARDDLPAPYSERCINRGVRSDLEVCAYGDQAAGFRVALVGDAHAAQWQPALESVAQANGWGLEVVTKTSCALGAALAAGPGEDRLLACQEWGNRLEAYLKGTRPDLLLIAQSPTNYVSGDAKGQDRSRALQAGLEAFIDQLNGSVSNIGLIRTLPGLTGDCINSFGGTPCERPREQALLRMDPILMVAEADDNPAVLLDLSDAFCTQAACANVVGNVVVYRGGRQMTATYARTAAAGLARTLEAGFGLEGIVLPAAPVPMGSMRLAEAAAAARRDNPSVYSDGCHVDQVSDEALHCTFGKSGAAKRIVIAGDSHSVHWIPAVAEVASWNDWELYSFTKSGCPFVGVMTGPQGRPYESCHRWNHSALEEIIRLEPDVLIMGMSRAQRVHGIEDSAESQQQLAAGLSERWRVLQDAGIKVLAIPDTPWMHEDVPDCLSAPGRTAVDCNTPREEAVRSPDTISIAATMTPGVETLTFADAVCDGSTCFAMIDGQVVWRDRHHLTATFARGLAPRFEPVLKRMMADNKSDTKHSKNGNKADGN